MKTRKNSFSYEKQSENEGARQVERFSEESSERDQSSITDVNSFRNNALKSDKQSGKNNTSGNYEKNQKESKHSFVVDWQIPKLSERDKNNYK